jgi:integrase
MKARNLTDLFVRNAKEEGEYSDLGQRGLRLAVHKTGRKSWVVRYRHPISGISRKLTLTPGLGLAAARKVAADAMFQVSQGVDPVEQKKADIEAKANAVEGTVQAVGTRFMELQGSKLRSASHYDSVLKRNIYPRLGSKQVAELKRTEIVAALDHVERTSGPSAADMALAVLRSVLHWHEKRSDTFRSPIIPGMMRVKMVERARIRVLSDPEIRAVWRACGDHRVSIYGKAVRFALLTGARRSEVSGLRRSEVEIVRDNGDEFICWRLPAGRSKNKREVVRPLSRAALDIINKQKIIGNSDAATALVFTYNGLTPLAMNSPKKGILDEISETSGWTIHDARRTFRSLLSRLRVPQEVSERLLGHSRPLLDKTYDQHSHLPAMQEAVNKLAAEIERIVKGGDGKVISIAR